MSPSQSPEGRKTPSNWKAAHWYTMPPRKPRNEAARALRHGLFKHRVEVNRKRASKGQHHVD